MDLIIPNKLKKGDTIGILSVSGDIKDFEKLEHAKTFFNQNGYNVKFSDTCKIKKNYLCGNDEIRANAINEFFADKEIKAIVAARGGYGAIRILDKINYDLIKQNPKIFCGYSDITALQLMIYKKTGLISFNAPMAYSDFGENINEYTKKSFFDILEKGQNGIILDNPKIYYEGETSGILWGGNLATIQSMCGLDFLPDKEFIFITEEINEPVYKIDKMFTQLLNIKKFKKNIAGIVLGNFSGVDNKEYLESFFEELSQSLKIPMTSGLKFGHEKEKQTFAIGKNVLLNTSKKIINYPE